MFKEGETGDGIFDGYKNFNDASSISLKDLQVAIKECTDKYTEKDEKIQGKKEQRKLEKQERKDKIKEEKAERLQKKLEKKSKESGMTVEALKKLSEKGFDFQKKKENGDLVFNRKWDANDFVLSKDGKTLSDQFNYIDDFKVSSPDELLSVMVEADKQIKEYYDKMEEEREDRYDD